MCLFGGGGWVRQHFMTISPSMSSAFQKEIQVSGVKWNVKIFDLFMRLMLLMTHGFIIYTIFYTTLFKEYYIFSCHVQYA